MKPMKHMFSAALIPIKEPAKTKKKNKKEAKK